MSQRWREKQHVLPYDTTGNEQAWSTEGDEWDEESEFPGPKETIFVDAQNTVSYAHAPVGDIQDMIDWEIGGLAGATKGAYSLGVVESTNVDAHDFNGQMQTVRRPADTNWGPVATNDHNSLLSLLYSMQESAHYFPNEVSEADLIKAV